MPDLDWIFSNKELLAIVVGFIGTYLTIRRQTKVFQTYVALEFFKRYAEISGSMPDQLRLAKYSSNLRPATDDDWKPLTRSMIQYGNLCSEEFALWKLGRIPDEIWMLWVSGIRENFETEIWRDTWNKVTRENESYEPFINFMRKLVEEGKTAELRRIAPKISA